MNMYNWLEKQIYGEKKPLPILSFPAVQELFVTVKDLVENSSQQALGMRLIADRYDIPASLSYMDLSVEAEAFGAQCRYGVDDVPTITGQLIKDEEDADALEVPSLNAGRIPVNIKAIQKASKLIHDRPILAGCVGPFSLAGRLLDVNEVLLSCYEEPEMVHAVLKKACEFLRKYIPALRAAGANGIIMAEPLAGLLSPELSAEFSIPYVRDLVDEFQTKSFLFVYHNCGTYANQQADQFVDTGCMAFHFGESADMVHMLETLPRNFLVMGNVSASGKFNNATEYDLRLATNKLLMDCGGFNNFIPSSGCDIPPITEMGMIDTFFKACEQYYYRRDLLELIS